MKRAQVLFLKLRAIITITKKDHSTYEQISIRNVFGHSYTAFFLKKNTVDEFY